MRSRRKKRSKAWIVILTLLILATAGVWVYFYWLRPPAAPKTPLPTPSEAVQTEEPAQTATASDLAEQDNPVVLAVDAFEQIWRQGIARVDELADKDGTTAALVEMRLSLELAHADLVEPGRLLEGLVQVGENRWSGQSVQPTPLPAYLSGSGETYSFGINAPEPEEAPQELATPASLDTPQASPSSLPAGYSVTGRCAADRLEYTLFDSGTALRAAQFTQASGGYLAQTYSKKGVVRIFASADLFAVALFPGMTRAQMGSLYDTPGDWQTLSQGAEQVLTCSASGAQLKTGDNVQSFQ